MATLIKGSSIKARLEFISSRYGNDTLDKVLGCMNEVDQKQLKGLVSVISQYPLTLNARLDEAIAKILDPNNPIKVYRELGKASAEANLTTIHKTFIKGGDPHEVLKRFPSVRSRYYSEGSAYYERIGDKEGMLKLSSADFTIQDNESTAGYFERAIELMGGSNVLVQVESRSNECTYKFSWS